jgi:hypothetical protein
MLVTGEAFQDGPVMQSAQSNRDALPALAWTAARRDGRLSTSAGTYTDWAVFDHGGTRRQPTTWRPGPPAIHRGVGPARSQYASGADGVSLVPLPLESVPPPLRSPPGAGWPSISTTEAGRSLLAGEKRSGNGGGRPSDTGASTLCRLVELGRRVLLQSCWSIRAALSGGSASLPASFIDSSPPPRQRRNGPSATAAPERTGHCC